MSYLSVLEEKLNQKKFPVTAEVFSVRGTGIKRILKKVDILKDTIDAFNVTDNHRATMRTCPMALCVKLIEAGVEPVMQITCRDRNRLALQSDVLGAYVLGIRNVLVITGDHLSYGDNTMAYPVFDLDSVQFLSFMSKLETGRDSAGRKLSGKPSFFKGAAVNLTARPDWIHLAKTRKKVKAGAQFFQSQLIFSPDEAISTIMKMKGSSSILAGVTILKSYDFTVFLRDKIPGIMIPDDIVRFMENAGDEIKAGLDIASNVIDSIKDHVDGLHMMAFGLEEHIPELLKKTGVK